MTIQEPPAQRQTLGGGVVDAVAWLDEIGHRGISREELALYAAYGVEFGRIYRDEALARTAAVAALEYDRGRVGISWACEQYAVAMAEQMHAWRLLVDLSPTAALCVEDRESSATVNAYISARRGAELAAAVCVAIARIHCAHMGGPTLRIAHEFGVGPAVLNMWLGRVPETAMPTQRVGGWVPAFDAAQTWAEWIHERSNTPDEEGAPDGEIDRTDLGKQIARAVLDAGYSLNNRLSAVLATDIRKHVI